MSETTPSPEDITESALDDRGAEPELPDQPLGTPPDADPDEAPLPGIPEEEPPDAG